MGFPGETDSGESTGEEDTLSIISISSEEGPKSSDEKEHPQKWKQFDPDLVLGLSV